MIVISKHEDMLLNLLHVHLACEFCGLDQRKTVHVLDSVRFRRDLPSHRCERCGNASIDAEETTKPANENGTLKELAKPLVDYIRENHNPHTTVIVSCTHAEILEGVAVAKFYEEAQDED